MGKPAKNLKQGQVMTLAGGINGEIATVSPKRSAAPGRTKRLTHGLPKGAG
jgi:hypothetical protein